MYMYICLYNKNDNDYEILQIDDVYDWIRKINEMKLKSALAVDHFDLHSLNFSKSSHWI